MPDHVDTTATAHGSHLSLRENLIETNLPPLEELTLLPNIAELLSKQELDKIAAMVIDHVDIDDRSMSDWRADTEEAIDLVEMKKEVKSTPWPNASNVKYPMIASAAIQFASRVSPEIVRGNKVVEIAAIGADPDGLKQERARRLSKHMSYQLLISDDSWEESNDKLLHILPIVGTVHKKTWFDPIRGKNMSVMVPYEDISINENITSLEQARRITHKITMHQNDIIQNIRAGAYLDIVDELAKNPEESEDVDNMHMVYEYHGYLDLDNDGYEEPYVITVHKDSSAVLRIVVNYEAADIDLNDNNEVKYIKPGQFFTGFHFLPSPRGTYWSVGFGLLLLHLNATTNTVINQLMDAGTLANMQGGFLGRGFRNKSGTFEQTMGKWHRMDFGSGQDLAKNIVPLTYKEPSTVLFQMLGFLVQTGKDLSSVTDVLTGQQSAQNVPATTVLALVEQGLKVFSAIQKRLHRAYKREFEKIFVLNRIHLDMEEYQRVTDRPLQEIENDYNAIDLDVKPVSDPNMSSDATRIAQGQALLQVMDHPTTNARAIMKRHLENLNVPDLENLLAPEEQPPTADQLEQELSRVQAQHDADISDRETAIKEGELRLKQLKLRAEAFKLEAEGIKNIAEAEAAEAGPQLQQYQTEADIIKQRMQIEAKKNEQGPTGPVDGSSNN